MGKNTLVSKTSLQYALTPQQIQYLKILQLPITSLEHTIKQEIEENPFLEELNDLLDDDDAVLDLQSNMNAPAPDQVKESKYEYNDDYNDDLNDNIEYKENLELETNYLDDDDSYDYYDDRWEDEADYTPRELTNNDKDYESFQMKTETTLYDLLLEQINVFDLPAEDKLIALYIIGNLDDNGYFRMNTNDILNEINSMIAKHNTEIQISKHKLSEQLKKDKQVNPAKKYELNLQSIDLLAETFVNNQDILKNVNTSNIKNKSKDNDKILNHIATEDIERVLKIIQSFEPPGIASKNIQECLLAQLKANKKLNESEKIAIMILSDYFEEFSKKYFLQIQKKLGITEDQVRDAFDAIKKLNPKPGSDYDISQYNTIIPDFIVSYDYKIDDFIVILNDNNVPTLKVSPTYEKMLIETRKNKNCNKETKDWMKERYENAKFFIQAVNQRSMTLLMIMTAIVHRQRDFFLNDVKKIKPMIYQHITDDTTLDISTVCRVVNDKYVQTSTGIYELKFFFSESLMSDDGIEIATKVIRDRLKELIDFEPKNTPYSDNKLTILLKKEGYNVARRTITKYRETMKIPVARLRKEI